MVALIAQAQTKKKSKADVLSWAARVARVHSRLFVVFGNRRLKALKEAGLDGMAKQGAWCEAHISNPQIPNPQSPLANSQSPIPNDYNQPSSFYCVDCSTREWEELPSMRTNRFHCGVEAASHSDKLFAVGGCTLLPGCWQQRHSTIVECFGKHAAFSQCSCYSPSAMHAAFTHFFSEHECIMFQAACTAFLTPRDSHDPQKMQSRSFNIC